MFPQPACGASCCRGNGGFTKCQAGKTYPPEAHLGPCCLYVSQKLYRPKGPDLCQPRAQPWEVGKPTDQAPTGRPSRNDPRLEPPRWDSDFDRPSNPGRRCAMPWADLGPALRAYLWLNNSLGPCATTSLAEQTMH